VNSAVLAAAIVTIAYVAGYVMGVDAQRRWERECAQMQARVRQVTEPPPPDDPFERWAATSPALGRGGEMGE
jgi:hypothetical protein